MSKWQPNLLSKVLYCFPKSVCALQESPFLCSYIFIYKAAHSFYGIFCSLFECTWIWEVHICVAYLEISSMIQPIFCLVSDQILIITISAVDWSDRVGSCRGLILYRHTMEHLHCNARFIEKPMNTLTTHWDQRTRTRPLLPCKQPVQGRGKALWTTRFMERADFELVFNRQRRLGGPSWAQVTQYTTWMIHSFLQFSEASIELSSTYFEHLGNTFTIWWSLVEVLLKWCNNLG